MTVTELFCGAGGSSTGLVQAGCEVVSAVDFWDVALKTHEMNHPGARHVCADTHHLDPAVLPPTDVLWASPSCTHHSVAYGIRRGLDIEVPEDDFSWREAYRVEPDETKQTMLDVLKFVDYHRYAGILVENVPAVTRWPLWGWWVKQLEGMGYRLRFDVLDASLCSDRGPAVPQSRCRMIVSGWRGSVEPVRVGQSGEPLGVEGFLSEEVGEPVHGRRKPLCDRTMNAIEKTLEKWPDEDRWSWSYGTFGRAGRPLFQPVKTVTTVLTSCVISRVGGVVHMRKCTVDEVRKFMGFPEDYKFSTVDQTRTVKQLGNSVVPAMARDAGYALVEALGRSGV